MKPLSLLPRQSFNPSCPPSSLYYACTSSPLHFLGCCKANPCTPTGCSDGNLAPLSFDIAFYEKIPDQQCASGSRWYTCNATVPPFMGCCKSNACAPENGCPVADLTAGSLDIRGNNAASYIETESAGIDAYTTLSDSLTVGLSQSVTSDSSNSATTSTTAVSSTAAAATETTANRPSSNRPTSSGTIAGAAAGGALATFILFGLLFWMVHNRRKSNALHKSNLDKTSINKPLESHPPTISAPIDVSKSSLGAGNRASAAGIPPAELQSHPSTPQGVSEMDGSTAPVLSPLRNITSPFPPFYPPGHSMNKSLPSTVAKVRPQPIELSQIRASGTGISTMGVPSPMSSTGGAAGSRPATTFSEMGA